MITSNWKEVNNHAGTNHSRTGSFCYPRNRLQSAFYGGGIVTVVAPVAHRPADSEPQLPAQRGPCDMNAETLSSNESLLPAVDFVAFVSQTFLDCVGIGRVRYQWFEAAPE